MIVAQDRTLEILQLTRKGWTQTEIARKLGLSKTRVGQILLGNYKRTAQEIDHEWKLRAAAQIDKIDNGIRENYEAWERSKLEAKKETSKIGENEKGSTFEIVEAKEWQCGDPRYWSNIIKLLDQRAKILSLYPEKQQSNETKVSVNVGVTVAPGLENLSDDELIGYLQESQRIAGAGPPSVDEGTDTIEVVPALPLPPPA